MLFYYCLYFSDYVCKFSGQSNFFLGKINKIKSYYDLLINPKLKAKCSLLEEFFKNQSISYLNEILEYL